VKLLLPYHVVQPSSEVMLAVAPQCLLNREFWLGRQATEIENKMEEEKER